MNDDVIDLTKYLERLPSGQEESGSARGNFSVWGGEGERSRFALPIWRSIYLVGGGRGGLTWVPDGGSQEALRPFFVLDLAAEPARTEFTLPADPADFEMGAPAILADADTIAIYLGSQRGRNWFLVLDDRKAPAEPLEGRTREDLLFLAGECAGLLFFRELAEAGGELDVD